MFHVGVFSGPSVPVLPTVAVQSIAFVMHVLLRLTVDPPSKAILILVDLLDDTHCVDKSNSTE